MNDPVKLLSLINKIVGDIAVNVGLLPIQIRLSPVLASISNSFYE